MVAKWDGHPLIQPAISPHAWYTSIPEQLAQCASLAQELDVPVHTHISETAFEVDNCQQQHGMSVVEWVGQHGILDTKLLAAHCVHINRHEMDMIAAAKAGIAHNPTSNLKLSSGIAPVAEMLEAGCNVGIGTDGTASNNDLDMFEEMRLAALIAKVKRNDPVDLPAKEALRLATIGGAKAIHLGHLTGSLEIGKRADLIVLNMDGVHNWPHFHNSDDSIYSRIVYAAKSTDVAHTMCNGRWLMRDRQLLTVDLASAQKEAAEVAKKIDAFVQWRESSPHNKLAVLAGPAEQASYEAQLKIRLTPAQVDNIHQELTQLAGQSAEAHEHHDTYFLLTGTDGEPHYLRIREETAVQNTNQEQVTVHLTLLGEDELTNYDVTISRAQHHGTADRPLRFYREYFEPPQEAIVQKARQQWQLHYKGVDFTINLDELARPLNQDQGGVHFLEIKSATESAVDAQTKAQLIQQLVSDLAESSRDAKLARYVDQLIDTD